MAKRVKSATEIQICFERLERLAGKILIVKELIRPKMKSEMLLHLGYTAITDENETGKVKYELNSDGVPSLTQQYFSEYKKCAEKIEKFYGVLNTFPTEKLKYICELRYVDGYAWNEIAKMLNDSLPTIYSMRSVIVNEFRKKDLEWVIASDKNCD